MTDSDPDPDEWKYATKRPVSVEWRGPYREPLEIEIETMEGGVRIDEEYLEEHGGYVIIRGVRGEIYPCALDVFLETYDVREGNL